MNVGSASKKLFLFWMVNLQGIFGLTGVVKTIAGGGEHHIGAATDCLAHFKSKDGPCQQARFSYPWGITFDDQRRVLYVADCGCPETKHANDKIRSVDLEKGMVTTIAGSKRGYKDGIGEEAQFAEIAGKEKNITAPQNFYIYQK